MSTTKTEPTPTVGMGVTFCGWSDREPGTVVSVSPSGHKFTFRLDAAKLLNGFDSGEPDALKFSPGGFVGHTSGVQRYEFTPNPDGRLETATRRKDGTYRVAGGTSRVRVGTRFKHYDYNF